MNFCILHKKQENPKDKEKYHSEANPFPKPNFCFIIFKFQLKNC